MTRCRASAGYDFVFIDKEHMFFDGAEMTDFELDSEQGLIAAGAAQAVATYR